MNVTSFLTHWSLVENPFRAEEARHDSVFARLGTHNATHPDFEKVLGDLSRPGTAIVFGEKGSGKTAIRLQIAERVKAYNHEHPTRKVFLVGYDDLNGPLDRFIQRSTSSREKDRNKDGRDSHKTLAKLRLVDHLDAVLHAASLPIIERLLSHNADAEPDLGEQPIKTLRRAEQGVKRDLLLLQTVYDKSDDGAQRLRMLRKRIKAPSSVYHLIWSALIYLGWIVPAFVAFAWMRWDPDNKYLGPRTWLGVFIAAILLWALILFKRLMWDRWMIRVLARRIAKQVRTAPKTADDLTDALTLLSPIERASAELPVDDSDERRYAMVARLRRVLALFGYTGIVVIVDRVDEPTAVAGDPDRMRAVVWPMLHNKFLQQEGLGVKLLLPIELRHELFRESSVFFQEARLDKQNMVERLSWTGAMLYDLCNARLRACLRPGASGPGGQVTTLLDLFEEDVTRQDLVDALDQMHQPRDAFKLLYQCMQEHCSNVTEEQSRWRIPRLVLEQVRKQQSDRVQMLARGVRPA